MNISYQNTSAPTFTIRLARVSDSDQISDLLREWLSFEVETRKTSIRESVLIKEILVATVAEIRKQRDPVIGFIHGRIHNDPISGGTRLFITALYAKKGFRSIGIGTVLLQEMISRVIREEQIVGVSFDN